MANLTLCKLLQTQEQDRNGNVIETELLTSTQSRKLSCAQWGNTMWILVEIAIILTTQANVTLVQNVNDVLICLGSNAWLLLHVVS